MHVTNDGEAVGLLKSQTPHRQTITEKNRLRSPLLRLPAELRNMIYRGALDTATFCYSPSTEDASYDSFDPKAKFFRHTPSLLLACQQVYHEGKPYLHNFSVLSLEVHSSIILGIDGFCALIIHLGNLKYDLRTVNVIEVDRAILGSMESYSARWFPRDNIPNRARDLFPALEAVVLPTHWCLDPESRSAVRACFDRATLKVTHN